MKALMAFIVLVFGAGMYVQAPPQLISYAVTANKGDTLWDICSKIATERDDVREIVYRAKQENNIKNPGELQPGMLIVVRVKEARK